MIFLYYVIYKRQVNYIKESYCKYCKIVRFLWGLWTNRKKASAVAACGRAPNSRRAPTRTASPSLFVFLLFLSAFICAQTEKKQVESSASVTAFFPLSYFWSLHSCCCCVDCMKFVWNICASPPTQAHSEGVPNPPDLPSHTHPHSQ